MMKRRQLRKSMRAVIIPNFKSGHGTSNFFDNVTSKARRPVIEQTNFWTVLYPEGQSLLRLDGVILVQWSLSTFTGPKTSQDPP